MFPFPCHVPHGGAHLFQLAAGVVLQAQHQRLARHRLPHRVGVRGDLVAYRRADEVRAVGVEALLHQQVDLPEIHHSQIDSYLLQLTRRHLSISVYHLYTIRMDGNTASRVAVESCVLAEVVEGISERAGWSVYAWRAVGGRGSPDVACGSAKTSREPTMI